VGLRDEIFEQPMVLRRWLETQLDQVSEVARAIRQRQVEFVFLAARGTSDHAGIYAQYLWGARNGLAVAFSAPSLFTRYGGTLRLDKALVVGVSQSGQSPDVVAVVAEGRRQGALTLALSNVDESPLAQAAEFTLGLRAGEERAVAATKTYTAELLAMAALSAALHPDAGVLDELWQVPAAVEAALGLEGQVAAVAAAHRELERGVVLGRGYHYTTAQEWALKLKELAYVLADPYSAADFQHGPIAIVEPGFPVLAVAPHGAVLTDVLALLRRLRDDYAADLLVLSDSDEALAVGQSAVRLPGGLPEWLQPIVSIVPAQLYCYHLTRAKGNDPDAPRHIRKVTLTR
jgi:glucosamine--fructose-6-phosphate aminotransferase (isomerizing)